MIYSCVVGDIIHWKKKRFYHIYVLYRCFCCMLCMIQNFVCHVIPVFVLVFQCTYPANVYYESFSSSIHYFCIYNLWDCYMCCLKAIRLKCRVVSNRSNRWIFFRLQENWFLIYLKRTFFWKTKKEFNESNFIKIQ